MNSDVTSTLFDSKRKEELWAELYLYCPPPIGILDLSRASTLSAGLPRSEPDRTARQYRTTL